ncbi:uncharacterized protein, YkwD family [Geosporobacter subterraneus DSM 17957]|uniref:Uncharacterized protein, YkwD family n=1 Tax=Geosporobacter subterraneus DSM 17957 TaxID=1121919 RepID=A0A1M6EX94_9FIRM|nr:CAP domain-containing protein [Geosporobacter subterraneus]SHI90104.1 uncharacterized protein, YkwD family [Geosporobacter subterraneus DSM 17957]
MKKVIGIFILLSLFAAACAPGRPQQRPMLDPQASSIFQRGAVRQIRIVNNNAPLRSGRSPKAPIIARLPQDKIYNVVGEFNNWYVIEGDQGEIGAVEPKDAQPHIEAPSMAGQTEAIARLTPNEEEMLRLLNAERIKKGLHPLKVDMEITKVARLKSQDMIDNNYFSHNSPTYGSPFDMMRQFDIRYIYAGENLAGNPTIQGAHTSLMNSQGHRDNILNPNFTHIGIGVREGSRYGKMATQLFVGR